VAISDKNRIVLRLSKESRVLRGIGAVLFLSLILLFIWAGIAALQYGTWVELLIYLIPILFFLLPSFFIFVREWFRKVVLLENYISIIAWSGLPKVYSYDQISNVETFVINEDKWTWEPETFVRVTFEDGRSIKVYKSFMSVREFRKFLRAKTGRTFRKIEKRRS
jgi:hypothetical protein